MASTTQDAWSETSPSKKVESEPWMVEAKCLHHPDKSVFYPAEAGSKKEAHEAKQVCAICPVKQNCLDYAHKHKERFGIWGGLTTKERVKLRRKNKTDA